MKFYKPAERVDPNPEGVYACPFCKGRVFGLPTTDYIVCVPGLAHAQFDKDHNLLNGNPAARKGAGK